ncbi:MAG TPA: SRPBCC family protein [Thermomonospora sp.]|nr:SRPBCC family protein [Thermomonospora sp.]
MRYEVTVTIDAPLERIWEILVDVERWPEWSASMSRVERLDPGPFGPGSRARIKQPRLPSAIWQVTEFSQGSSFTWVARTPGMTTTAGHTLSPAAGGTELRLTLHQTGPLAPLVGALAGRLARRYVDLEAEGLKYDAETP